MEDLERIYNYRHVDESLGTSGQPTVDQLRSIAAAGFDTIVNLALHDDPRYSLPDERGAVEALGLEYVHIPVTFAAPAQTDLLALFAAMEAHRPCNARAVEPSGGGCKLLDEDPGGIGFEEEQWR